MKLLIRKEAERDIQIAHAWYQQQSPSAARHFMEALGRTLTRLTEFPDAFPRAGGNTRRALLGHFPYTLYLCVISDRIEVHAVFHQRRKPQPRLIR